MINNGITMMLQQMDPYVNHPFKAAFKQLNRCYLGISHRFKKKVYLGPDANRACQ